jgi:tetratricopeptide (TPR) repeat protein
MLGGAAMALSLAGALGLPAARAEDQAEGKRRFVRGQELYTEGRFLDAAKEFEVGYAAAPRPAFLLNIGHCYRRAGQLERAKSYYEKLLQTDPQSGQRAEVEEHLRNIDDVLSVPRGAAPKRDPRATETPPTLSDPRLAFRRPVNETDSPPALESGADTESQESGGSVFGEAWFWAILIAVAAGGGIAAATLISTEAECPGTQCFTE